MKHWAIFHILALFSYLSSTVSVAAQEPLYSLEETAEGIRKYLLVYHPDFDRIRFVFEYPDSSDQGSLVFSIRGENNRLVLARSLPKDDVERFLFDAIASLLFQPDAPTVTPSSLLWLNVACFWDYRVRENPAWFDFLAKEFEKHDQSFSCREATSYWKFRLLMKNAGGRKALWRRFCRNPKDLIEVHTETPFSPATIAEIYEYIDYRASPVMSPLRSIELIRRLSLFSIRVDGQCQLYLLGQLSDDLLLHDMLAGVYEQRIIRIKSSITRVNPITSNALRSLGICFERLIENDLNVFRKAHHVFEQDFSFAESLLKKIESQVLPLFHSVETES